MRACGRGPSKARSFAALLFAGSACTGEVGESAGAGQADAATHADAQAADAAAPPVADAAVHDTDAGLRADAAALDAAVGDAGRVYSTNRDEFFGAPRCAGAGVQLCEDFEGGTLGQPPDRARWSVQTWGTGSAVLDDSQAARGSRSVHIRAPGRPALVMLRETETFPAPDNTFYGRVFVRIERIPEPVVWNDLGNYPLIHWTVAAASGPFTAGGMTYHPEVRAIGGINRHLLINVDGGPDHEYGIDDMPPAGHDSITQQAWMCFELEHRGRGAQAEMRVWWDGIEHPRLHLNANNLGDTNGMPWPIPDFESASFGWAIYQDYTAIIPEFDVWIDEIAVDTERIGCSL